MSQLIPSSDDKVAFTEKVWAKVEDIFDRLKHRHGRVEVPPSIFESMRHARRIALRHNLGDMRHTEAEMMHEQDVAQWCVEQWAELHNGPVPAIKFGPHH